MQHVSIYHVFTRRPDTRRATTLTSLKIMPFRTLKADDTRGSSRLSPSDRPTHVELRTFNIRSDNVNT